MKTDTYIKVSVVIFVLVSLGHLLRLTEGWSVLVGTFSLPMWISVLAVLVSAGIAVWGFSLLRKQH